MGLLGGFFVRRDVLRTQVAGTRGPLNIKRGGGKCGETEDGAE